MMQKSGLFNLMLQNLPASD